MKQKNILAKFENETNKWALYYTNICPLAKKKFTHINGTSYKVRLLLMTNEHDQKMKTNDFFSYSKKQTVH